MPISREYGRLLEQYCREEMEKREVEWTGREKTFAWFSKRPDYALGSSCCFSPLQPVGGGQVATVEHWRWFKHQGDRNNDQPHRLFTSRDADTYPSHEMPRYRLIAKAHAQDRLAHCCGFIDGCVGGCSATAAVFDKNVPQEIADRVAATLVAIGPQVEVFYALLDGSEGCALCRRPLRDEVSKIVGVGPDCAAKHKIPHSLAAASKRLEVRGKLLGETGLC